MSLSLARVLDHFYIFATMGLAIYSQLIMRWQVSLAGPLPDSLMNKALFVGRLLLTPWVITAIAASFFSGIAWMMAMTKFEVSYAYPWVSLNYVIVLGFGVWLFHETFTLHKLIGTILIIAGLIVITKSA